MNLDDNIHNENWMLYENIDKSVSQEWNSQVNIILYLSLKVSVLSQLAAVWTLKKKKEESVLTALFFIYNLLDLINF